jgi:hypothetical protein
LLRLSTTYLKGLCMEENAVNILTVIKTKTMARLEPLWVINPVKVTLYVVLISALMTMIVSAFAILSNYINDYGFTLDDNPHFQQYLMVMFFLFAGLLAVGMAIWKDRRWFLLVAVGCFLIIFVLNKGQSNLSIPETALCMLAYFYMSKEEKQPKSTVPKNYVQLALMAVYASIVITLVIAAAFMNGGDADTVWPFFEYGEIDISDSIFDFTLYIAMILTPVPPILMFLALKKRNRRLAKISSAMMLTIATVPVALMAGIPLLIVYVLSESVLLLNLYVLLQSE